MKRTSHKALIIIATLLAGCSKESNTNEKVSTTTTNSSVAQTPIPALTNSATATTVQSQPSPPPASTPAKDIKADTVIITDGGMGVNKYGGFSAPIGQNGAIGSPNANGPVKVYIFRNLDAFRNADQLGIHVGGAYLETEIFAPPNLNPKTVFKFVRDVDLNLTDEQLCRQFGIQN